MFIGTRIGIPMMGGGVDLYSRLNGIAPVTFFKDYNRFQNSVDADNSLGSPTGIYFCSRSASTPETYVDSNGVIQVVTTSNVPRYSGGYYDETGFHAVNQGYISERSSTNLLTRTDGTAYSGGLWTGWIYTKSVGGSPITANNSATSLINIPSSTTQSITYTGQENDETKSLLIASPTTSVGSVLQNDVMTVSFFAKLVGSPSRTDIKVNIAEIDSGGGGLRDNLSNSITLNSNWRKYSFTATMQNASCSRSYVRFGNSKGSGNNAINNGDTVGYEICAVQLEKLPYATSFIPTTTAPLTRNGDVLKYENAGNSTAEEETIIIQFTPNSTFANDGIFRGVHATDTKNRSIIKNSSDTKVRMYPNLTDSSSVTRASTTTPIINSSYIFAGVIRHSSPYVEVYINGISEGSYTDGDWANPIWGSYFYVGSASAGTNMLDGTIKRIVKYNRALTADEVAYATTILSGS